MYIVNVGKFKNVKKTLTEMKTRSIALTSCLVKPKPITGPKRMEKLKMIIKEGVPKRVLMIIIAMKRLI